MKSYQESYDAGRLYGHDYRRTHLRWACPDINIARAAQCPPDHDMSAFFSGVLRGLEPFKASDFEEVFNKNAALAHHKATALLGKTRLHVATCNEAHYLQTLYEWEKMGAVLQAEGAPYEAHPQQLPLFEEMAVSQ